MDGSHVFVRLAEDIHYVAFLLDPNSWHSLEMINIGGE